MRRIGTKLGVILATGDMKFIEVVPPIKPIALAMRELRYLPSWLLRPFLMMFVTTNLAPSHHLSKKSAILARRGSVSSMSKMARSS
jgi:hypothetical protein